jgi:hypothetical protein
VTPTCVLRKVTLLVAKASEQDIVVLQPKTVHQQDTGHAESGNMKINEVIVEGHDGKKPTHHTQDTGMVKFRDKGGYDRTYHLNRIMMATAMADGSDKPLEMDQASFVEKFNLAHPYTEAEHKMLKQAFATVDSEVDHVEPDHKSKEHPDVHFISPVPARKKNKYGV